MTQRRDSHGRFKADHRNRNVAIGAATAIGAVASAVGAALHFGLLDRWLGRDEGHDAPDLALDADRPGTAGRAPDAFRPQGDAPVSAADREALRPATLSAATPGDLRTEEATQAHPS